MQSLKTQSDPYVGGKGAFSPILRLKIDIIGINLSLMFDIS